MPGSVVGRAFMETAGASFYDCTVRKVFQLHLKLKDKGAESLA
jgi:hypothetical protein